MSEQKEKYQGHHQQGTLVKVYTFAHISNLVSSSMPEKLQLVLKLDKKYIYRQSVV